MNRPTPRRPALRARISQYVALACVPFALTGCITSKKYKMAAEKSPPAQSLDWSVSTGPAELVLDTVIIIKGPGSWKMEARWDEYVVQVTNHGDQPVTVDSATLLDMLGQPQVPGDDPWILEKLSYTNWEKYGKSGVTLLAGAGGLVAWGAAVMASSEGMMGGAAYGSSAAGAGAASAMLVVIPVIALIDISAVAVMNHNHKKAVQAEFDRRRLPLPLALAPGATAKGSFFFPMTPGPQRLTLKGKSGEAPFELVLELKPLAGLHLKPVASGKSGPSAQAPK